jgi:hypothetical protein
MLLSDCFRDAVHIDGQKVVLVVDYVGGDPSHFESASQLMEAGSEHPPVWINEEDIAEIRRNHGSGVKVYGVWQLLFHNNLVEFNKPAVIRLNSYSGLYFSGDGRSAITGEYISNMVPGRFDIDASVTRDLNVDASSLTLPSDSAMLASEIYAQRFNRVRRVWVTRAALIAGVALMAAGTDLVLSKRSSDAFSNLAYSIERGEKDKQMITDLKQRKVDTFPNQYEVISRLAAAAVIDEEFMLAGKDGGDIRGGKVNILINEQSLNSPYVKFFDVMYRNDGMVELKWESAGEPRKY